MATTRALLELPEKKLSKQSKNEKIAAVGRRSKRAVAQVDDKRPQFQIYSLRSSPITAYHLIASIKAILPGCTRVPFNLEVSQSDLRCMLQAYTKPFVEGGKPRRSSTRSGNMQNLLMLLRGTELTKLRVYMMSSFFTFCYFLRKHRNHGSELTDAYTRIKHGIAPSNSQISEVAKLIMKPGEKVNAERIRGIFRKNPIEMTELLNSNEALLDEVSEEDEACMQYYFRCFEIDTPIEQPRDEFIVFRNEDNVPLYVRGRKLLTLAEIKAREAARRGSGENMFDHEMDDENRESEEEAVNVSNAVYKLEVHGNVDDETDFEENHFKDNEDNCKDIDIGDDENMDIEGYRVVDFDGEEEAEIDIDQGESMDNLTSTWYQCTLQTTHQSMLESSSTATYKSFEKYFNNEQRSDVKFVFFDGRCIHAHAIILENKSDAFADIFPNDVSVTTPGIVNVKDIDYEVMYEAIRFVYTDTVHNLENFAMRLLEPAKRFMLEDLKILCEEQLCKDMSLHNVIEMLILAEDYDLCTLKEKAIQFVATNMKEIVHLAKFEILMTHCPQIALEIVRCSAVK